MIGGINLLDLCTQSLKRRNLNAFNALITTIFGIQGMEVVAKFLE